jgi:hypothetical protein
MNAAISQDEQIHPNATSKYKIQADMQVEGQIKSKTNPQQPVSIIFENDRIAFLRSSKEFVLANLQFLEVI